jgi:nitrous oxide reductase
LIKRTRRRQRSLDRRKLLLSGTAFMTAAAGVTASAVAQQPAPAPQATASGRAPNIVVIFGDDIGTWNIQSQQPRHDGLP